MLYSENYPEPDESGDVAWRSGNDIWFKIDEKKEMESKYQELKLLKEGEDGFDPEIKTYYDSQSGWQYHLQQMVLEKEPLKYLEQFL